MLDLYVNIRKRRLGLKMSQDALAEITGYKDRSSIAKIEKGEVDISESKIREFAKALKTTPQELMGWDVFEPDLGPDEVDSEESLSNDPAFDTLRQNYTHLNGEGREKLVDYSDDLVQSDKYKKRVQDGLLQNEA